MKAYTTYTAPTTYTTTTPVQVRPLPSPQTETPTSLSTGLGSKALATTALTGTAAVKPASPTRIPQFQTDTFAPAAGRKPLSLSGGNENTVLPWAGPGFKVQPGAAGLVSSPSLPIRYALPETGGSSYQLSSEDRDSAERAIIDAFDRDDAQSLVDWLKDHPTTEDQAAFVDVLFQFGPGAADALNNVNTLYDSDRQLLADSLNTAYEAGLVTDEELQNSVVASGHGAAFFDAHEGLSDVMRRTGNPGVINAYVSAELDVARDNDGRDLARVEAAASALVGLSPQELQDYLASNPDDASFIVDNFNEASDGGYGNTEALGQLLETAADIQPPTPESLALFERSISHLGENQASREGAAEFFTRNTDAILARYMDDSGSLTLDGQEKLGHFFGSTLFSEPAIANREQLQEALLGKLGELSESLEPQATANPPSLAAQERARLLGSLIGTVEGGFQFAVDELEQKNEATEGFVDFVFQAGSLIPDLPFPGGGLVKDVTLDQIQEWVTDSLKEDAKEAKDSLPFHAAFAQGIDNPTLRTGYDSARGDAFQNVAKELID